ncbi:MAG TPA: hypothetical protein VGJ68_10665, partial [Bradyrhizobium sp.]
VLRHNGFSAFRTVLGGRLGFLFHGYLSAYSAKPSPRTIRGWMGILQPEDGTLSGGPFLNANDHHLPWKMR